MKRRIVPRIAPKALRDHADPARVDRIWERIESDLALPEAPARRRSSLWVTLAAASLCAFAGGVYVGKTAFYSDGQTAVAPSPDKGLVDVLAAGDEGRDFPLPGGGKITLKPGTTIEVQRLGNELQLKLVQGDATLETAQSSPAIVAGDARLAAQAGSTVSVSRRLDNMEVGVTKGSVSVSSPTLSKQLASGERVSLPLHRTASVAAKATPIAMAPAAPHGSARRPNEPLPPEAGPAAGVAPTADWQKLANAGDYPNAFKLLKDQPGGIDGAIKGAPSAGVLFEVRDVARKGGDSAAATRALTRIVDDFPNDKAYAELAANDLCKQFSSKDADKAQKYCERGKNVSETAWCNLIAAKLSQGHKDEAAGLAKEYVKGHPDGECIEEAERIARGDAASASPPAPSGSTAPSASGSASAPGQPNEKKPEKKDGGSP